MEDMSGENVNDKERTEDSRVDTQGDGTRAAAETRDRARVLEALLFVAPEPLTLAWLATATGESRSAVREGLAALSRELEERGSALCLVESGAGFRLAVRPDLSSVVERAFERPRRVKLSDAALETLAIIAYRQPVRRVEIQRLRGVNPDSSLATLKELGLIEEAPHDEGYVTTEAFLDLVGLRSLSELPDLEEDGERA